MLAGRHLPEHIASLSEDTPALWLSTATFEYLIHGIPRLSVVEDRNMEMKIRKAYEDVSTAQASLSLSPE